jgi:hypothetical protein
MRSFRAQSTLEYVIILGAIAAITLISVSVFKVSVKSSAEKMFDTLGGRIIRADK